MSYIPFGEKWTKEMMKIPKKGLVELLKKSYQEKKASPLTAELISVKERSI